MKIFPKQPQSITAELLSLGVTPILRTKLLLNTSFGNQKPLDSFLLSLKGLLLPATSRKLLNILTEPQRQYEATYASDLGFETTDIRI